MIFEYYRVESSIGNFDFMYKSGAKEFIHKNPNVKIIRCFRIRIINGVKFASRENLV